MTHFTRSTTVWAVASLLFSLLGIHEAKAQRILVDRQVKAGELIVFPAVDDKNSYYYVPDKARLATHPGTRLPQFSFLKYVENIESGRQGIGGGVVHAVVELSVTDTERRDAERELKRVVPGARLIGPVTYKSGTFALTSSFTDSSGELAHHVVGIGNAPILDGQKAAVSLWMTGKGATILWESFQTATPDISFTFEMQIEGFRAPYEARIEGQWEDIYKHNAIQAAVASPILVGEFHKALDDLRRSNTLRFVETGDDADLERIVSDTYSRILAMMFTPDSSVVQQAPSASPPSRQTESLLDRAQRMLHSSGQSQTLTGQNESPERPEGEPSMSGPPSSSGSGVMGAMTDTVPIATQEEETATAESPFDDPTAEQVDRAQAEVTPAVASTPGEPASAGVISNATGIVPVSGERSTLATKQETSPKLAGVATYRLKKVRRTGKIDLHFKKYSASTSTLRFSENIGDMRRYSTDRRVFREFNLDDPLYRQHEITFQLNVPNVDVFDHLLNFVSIELIKRHEGGDVTIASGLIDRTSFNESGAQIKLLYGWKGDIDRERWLEYEYRVKWSFAGGHSLVQPTTSSREETHALNPPYQHRRLTLEGDPVLMSERQIRFATVRAYSRFEEQETAQVKSVSTRSGPFPATLDIILPRDAETYRYELTWTLSGNRRVSTGIQDGIDDYLAVDEQAGESDQIVIPFGTEAPFPR